MADQGEAPKVDVFVVEDLFNAAPRRPPRSPGGHPSVGEGVPWRPLGHVGLSLTAGAVVFVLLGTLTPAVTPLVAGLAAIAALALSLVVWVRLSPLAAAGTAAASIAAAAGWTLAGAGLPVVFAVVAVVALGIRAAVRAKAAGAR